MRNIQTAVSPHPVNIRHMFIWTHLLGIVHTTTSKNIYYSSLNTLYTYTISPVAARSKALVCVRSFAGIAGSNDAGGMCVCQLWVLCFVR